MAAGEDGSGVPWEVPIDMLSELGPYQDPVAAAGSLRSSIIDLTPLHIVIT
jgi:hypothetical protein